MNKREIILPSAISLAIALFFACSSDTTSGEVRVFVTPDMIGAQPAQQPENLPPAFTQMNGLLNFALPLNAAPAKTSSTTNKVNCVGLNIMGPNISSALANEGATAWNNTGNKVIAGGKCGYAGVVSQILPVSTSAMIKVSVPYGNSRVVQLVGYKGVDCSKKLTASDLASLSTVPGVYEIGRAVSDIFTRKPEIEIEVDTTVIERIETPSLTDKTLLVPDLRCGLVGDEEKQFQTLVSGGTTNTGDPTAPSPTGTASPTATATATAAPTATATASPTPTPSPTATPEPTPTPTVSCPAGQYNNAGVCAAVGAGKYSTGDGIRQTCANTIPANSSYSNPNQTTATCQWSCNTGYYEQTNVDGVSSCVQLNAADEELLSCGQNQFVVGFKTYTQANNTLKNIYLRCASFTTTGTTTTRGSITLSARKGAAEGATSDAHYENTCGGATDSNLPTDADAQELRGVSLISVVYPNSNDKTDGFTFKCRNLANTGESTTEISHKINSDTPDQSFSCPNNFLAAGFLIKNLPNDNDLGAIQNILCRPVPQ